MKMKIAILLVLIAAAVGIHLKMKAYYKDLEGRFPEIDPSICRAAFHRFLKDALLQKIPVADLDDFEMDDLFLKYVHKVS